MILILLLNVGCDNGGKGKYCCTNGSNSPNCEIATRPTARPTTSTPGYLPPDTTRPTTPRPSTTTPKQPIGPVTVIDGFITLTTKPSTTPAPIRTTTTRAPVTTTSRATTTRATTRPTTTRFKGPTYLPPATTSRIRTTTTYIPRGTFTYGTYSIPKYTFR